jgi:hypothetical protein
LHLDPQVPNFHNNGRIDRRAIDVELHFLTKRSGRYRRSAGFFDFLLIIDIWDDTFAFNSPFRRFLLF